MNYLNLSPGAAPLVVKVSEGDIGREISFTLVEDGLEYSIPTGSTITCEILKSDGHGTSIPCTWSGSVVTFETTEQSTIRAGKATAELRIVNGADDIGTANFILAVEPRPINADTDQTDSSYSQTGDAGDVWTLGSNGTPSWAPSGLDASSATAGQAPIADGEGGWAWGDIEAGDSVPTEVKQAILALFQNGVYTRDDMSDEVAVIQSWATEVTAISLNKTTLNINGMETQTLIATTVPAGGAVTWSCSDTTICTVSGGVVTPMGINGTCTVTASCGGKSATCAVTVSGFATLVSISATYTQSGTVYDTDTLDSLKSDLVVTGTYSDSSTATITNYTLSGTLTEGTSTITVSYGGKTTTFNVTVSAVPVPETIALEAGTITETSSIGTSYDACKATHAVRYRTVEPIAVNIGDVINFSITGVDDTLGIYGLWFDSDLNYTGVHFDSWDYAGTYTVDQSYPYFGFACRTQNGQSNINASTAILTATITR